MPTRPPDINVEDYGGITTLQGMTARGYNWIEADASGEDYQPFGLGARRRSGDT